MDMNNLSEAPKYDEYDKEKEAGIETGHVFDHAGVHANEDLVKANPLARTLQGRHMQMIAIGMRAELS
jgi:amino acid permease